MLSALKKYFWNNFVNPSSLFSAVVITTPSLATSESFNLNVKIQEYLINPAKLYDIVLSEMNNKPFFYFYQESKSNFMIISEKHSTSNHVVISVSNFD